MAIVENFLLNAKSDYCTPEMKAHIVLNDGRLVVRLIVFMKSF